MIKVSCNWGKIECELHGSLPTLCADTSAILRAIYKRIEAHDEDAAEAWKRQFDNGKIQRCVFDPESVEKEVKETENKTAVVIGLLEFLKDMLGDGDGDGDNGNDDDNDNDDDDDEEDEEND